MDTACTTAIKNNSPLLIHDSSTSPFPKACRHASDGKSPACHSRPRDRLDRACFHNFDSVHDSRYYTSFLVPVHVFRNIFKRWHPFDGHPLSTGVYKQLYFAPQHGQMGVNGCVLQPHAIPTDVLYQASPAVTTSIVVTSCPLFRRGISVFQLVICTSCRLTHRWVNWDEPNVDLRESVMC